MVDIMKKVYLENLSDEQLMEIVKFDSEEEFKEECLRGFEEEGNYLYKDGKLDDQEETDEINACSIIVPVEIDGKTAEWLINFKNETHNHRDYKSRPLPNCDTEADVSLNKLFNFVPCKRVFIKYYDSNIINL